MKVSENFSRSEFACKCGCGFAAVDVELLDVLEGVRSHFREPVKINSGCRCEKHNSYIGGAKDSKHIFGIAADIAVENTLAVDVHKYLAEKYPEKYGIGKYQSWTHIDVREGAARW